MDIVFVGAGRLATQMALAFKEKGINVSAVFSRIMASAQKLCSEVGGTATDNVATLPLHASAYIIAVKDTAIADVVKHLHQGREDQLFIHTSGSVSINVFDSHFNAGVLYPLYTFSWDRQVDFSRIPIYIEGSDSRVLDKLKAMAELLSCHVEQLDSHRRRYLHLAAVFACNFTNHCYALAQQVLQQQGIGFDALLPIIGETAAKVEQILPKEAQTGPAIRYDRNTIEAHLQLLADQPMLSEVYRLMSQSIHQLAEKK